MTALAGELRKLPAFVRRDFLVAWSYRMSFATDLISLAGQALVFSFIGKMIDPDELPTFQGKEVTYLEFAAIGIALGVFITFGLVRVSTAIRNEQLMGTLESLLVTPTRTATLQIGSVFFDLVYIPLQTALFLTAVAIGFGLHHGPDRDLPRDGSSARLHPVHLGTWGAQRRGDAHVPARVECDRRRNASPGARFRALLSG